MSLHRNLPFLLLLLLTPVALSLSGCSRGRPVTTEAPPAMAPLRVGITNDDMVFHFPVGVPTRLEVRELEPWQVHEPGQPHPIAWSGSPADGHARIPRIREDKADRLYRQFLLVDAATGTEFGEPQFVTDFSGLDVRTHELLFPANIKGLTCVIDIADAVDLGVHHVNSGIGISHFVDWGGDSPGMSHVVDGINIPINRGTVEGFDTQMRQWTENDILYTPILLNLLPPERHPDDPLIHPQTDMENQPMGLGAFNMTSPEGVRTYIAFVEFLVERYTREDAAHGQIAALIIGNELQMHWTWHNMGNAPQDQIIREYMLSMRLAWLAARSIHRDIRVYNSMTHHWSMRGYLNDPLKEISGIDLLDGMLERGKAQGDFPWHVAQHPYPENLFEPAFWNDNTATMRFDAPRVTFKNLEVLELWLAQDHYLFEGQPRRIMLSEQGFHLGDGPDAEILQAAAYAKSWVKVSQMPTIDAYHFHRHAHHPEEGGLNLGVRDATLNADHTWTLGEKHLIYDVMKAAGTPSQEEAFAFALEVIGISSWDEAAPNYNIDRTFIREDLSAVHFDLFDLASTAVHENGPHLGFEVIIRDGGFPANAIFQHPPLGGGDSRLTYTLDLPALRPGRALTLTFDTAMKTSLSEDGVEFRAEIDGVELFSHRQITVPPQGHRIDLTDKAGQRVQITLITNRIESDRYDWSLWVQPRVIEEAHP